MPHCLIIAGPNGAGKTTFARTFLPQEHVRNFVNADLLAAGLSPLDPAAARLAAGRLFFSELDRLTTARKDFAFESTLSGLTYVPRLRKWRRSGYHIEIIYLYLDDVRLSLERIAARVRAGGHDVPETDVRRRFVRSWRNFQTHYKLLADDVRILDVSGPGPVPLTESQ